MAIYKISTARAASHAALMGVLRYVLNEDKTPSKLVAVSGHYNSEEITAEDVYAHFIRDKKLWNKDSGRMYTHCIVSFPPNECITLREAKEFGEEFAAQAFPGHQALIAVHEDKSHLHCHIILNSVNYHNGSKLHCTRKDLEQQRTICNDLCRQHGYSVPKKGKHIDGRDFDEHDFVAWNKKKYQELKKAVHRPRHEVDIFKLIFLIIEALLYSRSVSGFFQYLERHEWQCKSAQHRRYITFESVETGRKIRTTNLQRTFGGLFDESFRILDRSDVQQILDMPEGERTALLQAKQMALAECFKGYSGRREVSLFDPTKWREERMNARNEKALAPTNGLREDR